MFSTRSIIHQVNRKLSRRASTHHHHHHHHHVEKNQHQFPEEGFTSKSWLYAIGAAGLFYVACEVNAAITEDGKVITIKKGEERSAKKGGVEGTFLNYVDKVVWC